MVFDEWWTTGNGITDSNGEYDIRGFKGSYEITVDCGNGDILVDTVELLADQLFIKVDGALVADVNEVENLNFTVYPNPAKEYLHIQKSNSNTAQLQIFDMKGTLVFKTQMSANTLTVPLDFGSGTFEVMLKVDNATATERVIIE